MALFSPVSSSSSFAFLIFLLFSFFHSGRVDSEPTQDKQALLAFLSQTPHENRLQWNSSVSACDWFGVECDANRTAVYSVRLPGTGLVGQIPAGTLGLLTQLRVLSLRSNRLSGAVPADFSNLKLLRSLYLQDNLFSGEFPQSLTQLARLGRLDLSFNNFSGAIPFSVNNLTHLVRLYLMNNTFSGSLPNINLPNMSSFNVANNKLNGSIPQTLQRFLPSSFSGNLQLCGQPLPPCQPFFPSPAPSPSNSSSPPTPPRKKSHKLSKKAIIAISVAAGVIALLLLLGLILFCLRRRARRASEKPPKSEARAAAAVSTEAGTSSSKEELGTGGGEGEKNKLVFFEGGVYNFDLEDLLRASAEVLGKGSVGTSYKAVLEEGTIVVVKRLKDVVVTKREFEMRMEVLGKVKHDNVVPLRAFYYSKDEKLLVSDYMASGSLSSLLHGTVSSPFSFIFFFFFD